eukprot:243253_1
MSLLQTLYNVIIYLVLYICTSTSQTTICVWNSHNSRDHYNGEYTIASTTQLNKPYWTKSSSCSSSSTQYIQYVQDSYGYWWMIGDSLQPTYIDGQPYCEKPIPSNPVLCTTGWHYWYSSINYGQLSLTVTDGKCPTLQCNKIKLSNTGYSECNKVFIKDNNMDNVYINGITYLYFNKQTFKWYCSNTLGINECSNDISITHFYMSSENDGWFDINIDQTVPWVLNNGNTATVECIGNTQYPTIHPTLAPTKNPSVNPSKNPSVSPTKYPTKMPSISTVNPSKNPTLNPSKSPTLNPSKNPTLNPSKNPSIFPTKMPTQYPSKNPTISPNIDPNKTPTLYPTKFPTQYPSKIPTESPLMKAVIMVNKSTNSPNNEHAVEEMGSTIDNISSEKQSNNSESTNNNLNMFGININIVFYIIISCLFLLFIVFICMICLYCHMKKKEKNTKETNDINKTERVLSKDMSSHHNSINLCEFAVATTPNLTAMNSKMSEINQIDLNTKGETNVIDEKIQIGSISKITSISSITPINGPINSNSQLQNNYLNTEEEGDELYTMNLNRHVTIGQDEIITKGNEDENYDEMYIKPCNNNNNNNNNNQFVTAGADP